MIQMFTREGRAVQVEEGAKSFSQVRKCGRCGGAGGADKWAYTGWTCFDCGGSGTNGTELIKVYTAEKLAKFNEAADKRHAKKKAEADIETDKTKPQVGGAIRSWHNRQGWSYIQKVNKVTVTIWDFHTYSERPYRANVPFDKVKGIMTPAEVNMAKQEQRVREFGVGGKITGFVLMDTTTESMALANGSTVEFAGNAEPITGQEETFKQMQATLKAGIKVEVVNQLFPTPRELAEEVAEWADIQARGQRSGA